jgi:hypothetical protein
MIIAIAKSVPKIPSSLFGWVYHAWLVDRKLLLDLADAVDYTVTKVNETRQANGTGSTLQNYDRTWHVL